LNTKNKLDSLRLYLTNTNLRAYLTLTLFTKLEPLSTILHRYNFYRSLLHTTTHQLRFYSSLKSNCCKLRPYVLRGCTGSGTVAGTVAQIYYSPIQVCGTP